MKPLVSIIIPLYNKKYAIKWTIDSVLNQSYSNFELIIIDDGSTDGSDQIVKGFNDSRIRYIYKENGGVSSARNLGIRKAQSNWILLLDADDYLLEDGLECLIKGVQIYPEYKVVTDTRNNMYACDKLKWREINKDRLKKYSLFKFIIRTGNTLFHRSCFEKCGYFDERLSLYEDFKLFVDIIRCFPILQCNKKVFVYDTTFSGLSGGKGLLQTDFLMDLALTGDTVFDNCLLNYLGMRYDMAECSGDQDICHYICDNFPLDKASFLYGKSKKWSLSIQRKLKILFIKEIISSFINGHFETNKKSLMSLSHSRFGKFGSNVHLGKHCMIDRVANVFIYDDVIIGRNMTVDSIGGRLIIRSGCRIGNNFHVNTFSSKEKMNVVIGKNVIIGDNVSLSSGTYIYDGEKIPSDSVL